jgi:hypothetical protein
MTGRLIVTSLALLAAGGLGLLAWRQHGELQDLRHSALNRTERSDLQRRIWELERQNRELRDASAAANRSGRAADPATAGSAPERASGRPARPDPGRDLAQFNALREAVARPDVQALVQTQVRGAVESRYGPLLRSLNLTPDRQEQLRRLLVERTLSAQDVLTAAFDQGLDARDNPASVRKLLADAQEEVNRSIRSTVGEPAFNQLVAYEQTLPQRGVVTELQARLAGSESSLTPAQADQLVALLAANPPPRTTVPATRLTAESGTLAASWLAAGPLAALASGDASRAPAISPAAVAQAPAFLTPAQVTALQDLQRQQETQQQLRQVLQEALPPRPGAPPGGRR